MKLDSITKIERFMANALLSSPLVPLGVNVVRLADVSDQEGILQMVNSIVVRYVSSSEDVERQAPLTIIRTMRFEVNIASQSYLSQSGHDFAVQLCCASHETLTNTVPPNAGVEVFSPFRMVSEQFAGLTDSTHYTYTQTWELIVQDMHRGIAIDPCVQRGDCTRLFPAYSKDPVKPGDVLYLNKAYVPVLPPPPGVEYSSEYLGVEEAADGSLVYTWDPTQVFLSAAEIASGYYLVSTNTFDDSDQFLIANIRNGNGDFIRTYFAGYSGRLIVNITIVDGPSMLDSTGNPTVSAVQDQFATRQFVNGYGYANVTRAFISVNPTDPDAARGQIAYGIVFPIQSNTTLVHDGDVYLLIGNTQFGKAWVKEDEFRVMTPEEYLPRLDCDEGLDEGNTTSCE